VREGNVLLGPALWMGGGGVAGAILGALLAAHVPGMILARVWGALLVLTALRLSQDVWKKAKVVKAAPPS
jgi:uncharacterized membrane protein YfcA